MKNTGTQMPMEYKLPLSGGRFFILKTPVPVEMMKKRERKYMFDWIVTHLNAVVNKTKIEKQAEYLLLKDRVAELDKEWGFSNDERTQ